MTTLTVMSGGNGVFNLQWKASSVPGSYIERFKPVIDGHQWLPDVGMQYVVTVQ